VVKKEFSAFSLDEPETTIRDQLLNLTFWHFSPPKTKNTLADGRSSDEIHTIGTKKWEQIAMQRTRALTAGTTL
jgi:hypothetical protein